MYERHALPSGIRIVHFFSQTDSAACFLQSVAKSNVSWPRRWKGIGGSSGLYKCLSSLIIR